MNAETADATTQLMEAIRDLWEMADPPPPDLADGVLAALAAADLELEYELMTLIEASDLPAGVRGRRHHALARTAPGRSSTPATPATCWSGSARSTAYVASTAGWSPRWR